MTYLFFSLLAQGYKTTKQLWETKHKALYNQPTPPSVSLQPTSLPTSSVSSIKLPSISVSIFRKTRSSTLSSSVQVLSIPQARAQTLNRAGTHSSGGGARSSNPTSQQPATISYSPVPLSASTPSVHNAILALGDSYIEARRKLREDKIAKRVQKEDKIVKKGESRTRGRGSSVDVGCVGANDRSMTRTLSASEDVVQIVEGLRATRVESMSSISGTLDLDSTLSETATELSKSTISSRFLNTIPADGLDAMSFVSLGDAGWDVWGSRDESLVDARERRGDCCTVSFGHRSTLFRFFFLCFLDPGTCTVYFALQCSEGPSVIMPCRDSISLFYRSPSMPTAVTVLFRLHRRFFC